MKEVTVSKRGIGRRAMIVGASVAAMLAFAAPGWAADMRLRRPGAAQLGERLGTGHDQGAGRPLS